GVVEPVGDDALLVFAQTLHGLLLLGQIARKLDAGFYRLHLVAHPHRKLARMSLYRAGPRSKFGNCLYARKQCGHELLDGYRRPLQELREEIALDGCGWNWTGGGAGIARLRNRVGGNELRALSY